MNEIYTDGSQLVQVQMMTGLTMIQQTLKLGPPPPDFRFVVLDSEVGFN